MKYNNDHTTKIMLASNEDHYIDINKKKKEIEKGTLFSITKLYNNR